MSEQSYWVFVVNQAEKIDGSMVSAEILCDRRFKAGYWPIYSHTPNRKQLAAGDRFIVYLAGNGPRRQCFVASGVIQATGVPPKAKRQLDGDDIIQTPSESLVALNDPEWFKSPVNAKELLDKLSIIPTNKGNWGCVFQKGCKRISPNDFEVILAASRKAPK